MLIGLLSTLLGLQANIRKARRGICQIVDRPRADTRLTQTSQVGQQHPVSNPGSARRCLSAKAIKKAAEGGDDTDSVTVVTNKALQQAPANRTKPIKMRHKNAKLDVLIEQAIMAAAQEMPRTHSTSAGQATNSKAPKGTVHVPGKPTKPTVDKKELKIPTKSPAATQATKATKAIKAAKAAKSTNATNTTKATRGSVASRSRQWNSKKRPAAAQPASGSCKRRVTAGRTPGTPAKIDPEAAASTTPSWDHGDRGQAPALRFPSSTPVRIEAGSNDGTTDATNGRLWDGTSVLTALRQLEDSGTASEASNATSETKATLFLPGEDGAFGPTVTVELGTTASSVATPMGTDPLAPELLPFFVNVPEPSHVLYPSCLVKRGPSPTAAANASTPAMKARAPVAAADARLSAANGTGLVGLAATPTDANVRGALKGALVEIDSFVGHRYTDFCELELEVKWSGSGYHNGPTSFEPADSLPSSLVATYIQQTGHAHLQLSFQSKYQSS